MSWKRSKDGGLDFNTEADKERRLLEERYERAKQQMFGTAHTVTYNLNQEHVEF